jgi:Zn-dependent protease
VSELGPSLITHCPGCKAELPLGALACPECHTLVHAVRLEQLARDARGHEVKGRFLEARELWEHSLTLLPHDANQAYWVQGRIDDVKRAQAEKDNPTQPVEQHAWAKKFGPLAPILIVLAKSKGLLLAIFKLKFLFSFFTFLWLYVLMFGVRFGVGITVSILLHELGHFIDIRRRGLPVEMPMFIPGLGAYVKWQALGVTGRQIAQVSLAGPLAGMLTAAGCSVAYAYTHDPIWAALARTGAILNVLNLIPIWTLDGGQAVRALGQIERIGLLAASLALWAFTQEGIFFILSAVCIWPLIQKDKPQREDWQTWLYYVAVLAALAMVLHTVPESLIPATLNPR